MVLSLVFTLIFLKKLFFLMFFQSFFVLCQVLLERWQISKENLNKTFSPFVSTCLRLKIDLKNLIKEEILFPQKISSYDQNSKNKTFLILQSCQRFQFDERIPFQD